GARWQLVDLDSQHLFPAESSGHVVLTSMVATASGYVALGGSTSALAAAPVFLLVSTNGVQWTRVADGSMPGAGEFGQTATVVQQPGPEGGFGTIVQRPAPAPITALAADGGRVLALTIDRDVRWRPRDNATINHIAPAVWESADGRSW